MTSSIETSLDRALEKLNNAPQAQESYLLAAFSMIIDSVGEEAALALFTENTAENRGAVASAAVQVGILRLDNNFQLILNPDYLEHKRKVDNKIAELLNGLAEVPEEQFDEALSEVIAGILSE